MFTGLIECVGIVTELQPRGGCVRLTIAAPLPETAWTDGESVAVDGVCLTLCGRGGARFWADAIPETLALTTLQGYAPGRRVNLERALRLGDRLGGHLLQGHVDGRGLVTEVRDRAGDRRLSVELPPPLRRYVALKGSVALDGVSLTVAGLGETGFEVALIPETLSRTTLGERRTGDQVNVEVDLLARYLERIMEGTGGEAVGERPGSGS